MKEVYPFRVYSCRVIREDITHKNMKNYTVPPSLREKKHIRNQSIIIAEERLSFE